MTCLECRRSPRRSLPLFPQVLAPYLPPQLLSILAVDRPADQLAAALQADVELPTLLWNESSRRLLIHSMQRDLGPFCARLLLARATAADTPPRVRFALAPTAPIRYVQLERELSVGRVLLRFFSRHEGLAPVPEPERLDAQLVAALAALTAENARLVAQCGHCECSKCLVSTRSTPLRTRSTVREYSQYPSGMQVRKQRGWDALEYSL